MRGRKRQRKKNEKRRGVYGLPIMVTAKRPREQPVADALATAIARWIAKDPDSFYQEIVRGWLRGLAPAYHSAKVWSPEGDADLVINPYVSTEAGGTR